MATTIGLSKLLIMNVENHVRPTRSGLPLKVTAWKTDYRARNSTKKCLEIVENNMSEPAFSVEEFGAEMGMSRVSLYKKMLALTDKTPTEFIRIIRLKRAADLFTTSQLSVSEIAYRVGFNNPRYFSKYFAEQYNMLHSEYISRHRNEKIQLSDETREKFG